MNSIPLNATDYAAMGFANDDQAFLEVSEIIENYVPKEYRQRLNNVTQRVHDTIWITDNVISEMKQGFGIGIYEGLLSLALYLFLTCADTLGYLYKPQAGAKERFILFFENLPLIFRQI